MKIDDMPAGRDLDVLVAEKVMGWRRGTLAEQFRVNVPGYENPSSVWHHQDGVPTDHYAEDHETCCDCGHTEEAWSPSTKIADAWDVVERLKGYFKLEGSRYGWFAWFLLDHACHADTAPLAICRAALKVV